MAESQSNAGIYAGKDLHARDISVVQNIINHADPPPKNIRFKVQKPIQTFTGREAFLEELHKLVEEGQDGGEGGVTVLTQEPFSVVAATGGIGKTETVRMYIQLYQHKYNHIIWIDADEASSAKIQFGELSMKLKISSDFKGKPKPFDLLLTEIFEKLICNILLVFDNAEAYEEDRDLCLSGIRDLIPESLSPPCVKPKIIVTSRNQNWGIQKVIHLDLWTDAEVVCFVIFRLRLEKSSENKALALQLGTLFGRLPIALQAAVAVILQQIKRKKKYGIQSLITEYERGSRKVLAQKPVDANMRPTQASIPMLVLWNISLEKIVRFEDGTLAIEILCFMAYMSPTRIPQDYLFALFKNSTTEDSFENALEILEDYSLIASLSSDNSGCRSLSIHRMIQDSTIENLRTRTNQGETPHFIFNEHTFLNETQVLSKLAAESMEYTNSLDTRTLLPRGELVETLVHMTNHASEKLDMEEFRDFTQGTASLLRMTNNCVKSIELFIKVFEATSSRDETDIMRKFNLLQELAATYRECGYVKISLDLYLQVLEVYTCALGPHHEETLDTKSKVANVLHCLGRYDEAMEMYLEVLQVYENKGETQSPNYLEAKSIFVALLLKKGRKNEASELLTQVLKEQENNPVPYSRSIIVTKVIIAFKLTNEGHLEEASKIRFQNIEDATKLFGPFDLFTLSCRQAYAAGLIRQKKYDLATLLLLELLETEEAQLSPHHPSTLKTKCILAEVYLATEELEKAEALLDVQVLERILGPEDVNTLKAVTFLSYVKERQEKFGVALELHKKVFKVRKNDLGPNHEETLRSMLKIGILYFKMKQYKKATEVAQELLNHQEEAFGKDHPDTIEALELLTLCTECLVDRNNLILVFMAWAPVDAETGKLFLKAANWDIEIFMALTGVNAETGKAFLDILDWNLKDSLEVLCESRLDEDIANMDLQDNALISSSTITDAENQHVATSSCNETKVNRIQDLRVQVEFVAEFNEPTTSISFCWAGRRQS